MTLENLTEEKMLAMKLHECYFFELKYGTDGHIIEIASCTRVINGWLYGLFGKPPAFVPEKKFINPNG